MKQRISGFLTTKWAPGLGWVAALCLTTGFVRSPFPRWTSGEVTAIDPKRTTLEIREDVSKKSLALLWDKNTRLWVEPARRNRRGSAFDPESLALGAPVQIMFKKYSHYNLVTRVIRTAPSKSAL